MLNTGKAGRVIFPSVVLPNVTMEFDERVCGGVARPAREGVSRHRVLCRGRGLLLGGGNPPSAGARV